MRDASPVEADGHLNRLRNRKHDDDAFDVFLPASCLALKLKGTIKMRH